MEGGYHHLIRTIHRSFCTIVLGQLLASNPKGIGSLSKREYRIGANTTALLIITASRVNSNIKAPKLLNLNNTTAS